MNIVLTGYMASGKTTLGAELSKRLSRTVVDTDVLVTEKMDMSVSDIFSKLGEDYFRHIETQVIEELARQDALIIATGGGAVLNSKNIGVLRENGIIVNLCPDEETIMSRLSGKNSTRPLASGKNMDEILARYRDRKPFYDNCDVKILITRDMSVEQTLNEILEKIEVEI